jgi:hypothetical protein
LFLLSDLLFCLEGDHSVQRISERKSFLASFILANGQIVGLATENWDGRFSGAFASLYFYPCIGAAFPFSDEVFYPQKKFSGKII